MGSNPTRPSTRKECKMELKKYRKKPVVIEAFQLQLDTLAYELINLGFILTETGKVVIQTLEGDMVANVGDWIIKGIAGEFYPCKPDIFDQTYEVVE